MGGSVQIPRLVPFEAALSKLADKIAALRQSAGQTPGSGVFDQIKNMIQTMIFHLMSRRAAVATAERSS